MALVWPLGGPWEASGSWWVACWWPFGGKGAEGGLRRVHPGLALGIPRRCKETNQGRPRVGLRVGQGRPGDGSGETQFLPKMVFWRPVGGLLMS